MAQDGEACRDPAADMAESLDQGGPVLLPPPPEHGQDHRRFAAFEPGVVHRLLGQAPDIPERLGIVDRMHQAGIETERLDRIGGDTLRYRDHGVGLGREQAGEGLLPLAVTHTDIAAQRNDHRHGTARQCRGEDGSIVGEVERREQELGFRFADIAGHAQSRPHPRKPVSDPRESPPQEPPGPDRLKRAGGQHPQVDAALPAISGKFPVGRAAAMVVDGDSVGHCGPVLPAEPQ